MTSNLMVCEKQEHYEHRTTTWDSLDPLDKKILKSARDLGWVSQQWLADVTHKHRTTIVRRIRRLEKAGWLKWTHAKTRRSTVAKRYSQLLQNVSLAHRDIPVVTSSNIILPASPGSGGEVRPQQADIPDSFDDQPKRKTAPTSAAMGFWKKRYIETTKSEWKGNYGMALGQFKALTSKHGEDATTDAIHEFFQDDYAKTAGFPIKLFISQVEPLMVRAKAKR